MALRNMLRDRVTLVKQDGRRFEDLRASVQSDKVFTNDPQLPIEEGDTFERALPNGLLESYTVIDRGFMQGMGSIPSHYQSKVQKVATDQARKEDERMLKLFVSHSSKDVDLVVLLVNLIRSGLNLSANDIRCTSVDGYRLPGGANTMDQIRCEVHDAEAFIGVISTASLDSMYVAFELGARWGAHKHLLPILASGTDPSILAGPLAGMNALRCDSAAQLHQLIADLAKQLGVNAEPAAVLQAQIDQILSFEPPYLGVEEERSTPLFDDVRLDAAKELLKFLSKVLNREAPDKLKDDHLELRDDWALHNRHLYLLNAPEDLREKFDDRMVQYLRALRELASDPTARPEVERQRDLAKREARQLLLRLGLAADW